MLCIKLTLLLLAGCTLICASPATDSNVTKPSTTSTTSTSTTTTTTSTPPPTPSTTTTTTSTPAPTTSTSSTPLPTTSTTAAPSTTPAPMPYPAPDIGTWNSSCIMVKMALQLNFTYETKDNTTATTLYNLPKDAEYYDSICGNLTQNISLQWGKTTTKDFWTMQFEKVNNTAKLTMMKFNIALTSDSFPNAKANQSIQLIHSGNEFGTPFKMSYHCTRSQRLNFTETLDSVEINGFAIVHDVQTEAFRSVDAKGFADAHDCDSSNTSDIVPIAVGIALVVLILIVLVSYLCARRRSTSRGYMSF